MSPAPPTFLRLKTGLNPAFKTPIRHYSVSPSRQPPSHPRSRAIPAQPLKSNFLQAVAVGTEVHDRVPATTLELSQRVLLVDEQPIFRRGLAALISEETGLSVCGQFADRRAALDAIPAAQPELVIIELSPKDGAGIAMIRDIKVRHPRIRILVLSQHAEALYAERSLRAGANGFVSKDDSEEVVIAAIRMALAGQTYLSPILTAQMALKFVGGTSLETASPLAALSNRELQVFRLIGLGQSTREISEALCVSFKTVETHREHLKVKLGLCSGEALARRAVQWVETGLFQ